MPAFRSVVSVLESFVGRSFSTNSRPALRAAACGGRPRAGSDTTATGRPASPTTQARTDRYVNGVINLQVLDKPDAPTNLQGVPGNKSVALTWDWSVLWSHSAAAVPSIPR